MVAYFLRTSGPINLELVGGEKGLDPALSDQQVCEEMFARYNRGSGREVEFAGPSMSVGDFVVIFRRGQQVAYECRGSGFDPVVREVRQ